MDRLQVKQIGLLLYQFAQKIIMNYKLNWMEMLWKNQSLISVTLFRKKKRRRYERKKTVLSDYDFLRTVSVEMFYCCHKWNQHRQMISLAILWIALNSFDLTIKSQKCHLLSKIVLFFPRNHLHTNDSVLTKIITKKRRCRCFFFQPDKNVLINLEIISVVYRNICW